MTNSEGNTASKGLSSPKRRLEAVLLLLPLLLKIKGHEVPQLYSKMYNNSDTSEGDCHLPDVDGSSHIADFVFLSVLLTEDSDILFTNLLFLLLSSHLKAEARSW